MLSLSRCLQSTQFSNSRNHMREETVLKVTKLGSNGVESISSFKCLVLSKRLMVKTVVLS